MENSKNIESLCTRLEDWILNYIQEHHLKNGDRLPSEREIAESFNVSRSSVREAIRILKDQGLIIAERGRGMFLQGEVSDQRVKIALWRVDYEEMLEVKTILELHVIEELCSTGVSEAELRNIEESLNKLEESYHAGVFSITSDNIFHNRIRRLCKNQTLIQLLDNLISKLDSYGRNLNGIEKYWLATIPFHRDLYNAIKERNYIKARSAYTSICNLDKQGLDLATSKTI